MREELEDAEASEWLGLSQRIASQSGWLDELYRAYLDQIRRMEAMGLEADEDRTLLAEKLEARAGREAARLELVLAEMQEIHRTYGGQPEGEVVEALRLLSARRDTLVAGLENAIAILEGLGGDASRYQQLLIIATGEITADIFRTEVALGLLASPCRTPSPTSPRA